MTLSGRRGTQWADPKEVERAREDIVNKLSYIIVIRSRTRVLRGRSGAG